MNRLIGQLTENRQLTGDVFAWQLVRDGSIIKRLASAPYTRMHGQARVYPRVGCELAKDKG